MALELARRGFLTGLGAALITAPAIVRAGSLMPVKIWLDLNPGDRPPYDVSAMDIARYVNEARGRIMQVYRSGPEMTKLLGAAANEFPSYLLFQDHAQA